MSTGDILVHQASVFGEPAAKKCNVAASATLIYPGEPVVRSLGAAVVTPMATNKPVVATDFIEGIATTKSTNTAGAAGEVYVLPLVPGTIYKMKPKVAATFDTQSEYDALIGARVLIDLTGGAYTILAADGATSGCVIEYIDVARNPGYVAFSFRNGCTPLA
jgi:hypothetical protein